MKKVAFYTLGCKLNFSETSTIARDLYHHGFEPVDFDLPADLYVINTCSVTENANRKCRKIIRQALRHSPHAFITVVGCYAQLKPEEISAIPGVDLVLGANEKFNIADYWASLKKKKKGDVYSGDIHHVNTFIPSYSTDERTRSFLKVQDGCDYSCSYCTIPLARGESRSQSIEETVKLAQEIAERNIKEIVLTGVNVADFGNGNDESFIDLLQRLDRIDRIGRVRISSIEPNLLSDEIIEFVASSRKFVPHFHMPLQSGCNKILCLMRRRYSREDYADRVSKIKSCLPHCCIGMDVIAGFPGETENDFLECYEFINSLDVSYLHVFSYSERPHTDALQILEVVPYQERLMRSKMLQILSEKKKRFFYDQHVGKILPVLFETSKNGHSSGITENYIKVEVAELAGMVNQIRDIKLIKNRGDKVFGELLN